VSADFKIVGRTGLLHTNLQVMSSLNNGDITHPAVILKIHNIKYTSNVSEYFLHIWANGKCIIRKAKIIIINKIYLIEFITRNSM